MMRNSQAQLTEELTSPFANVRAPRRSRKHNTAPSGSAIRVVVPAYPHDYVNSRVVQKYEIVRTKVNTKRYTHAITA